MTESQFKIGEPIRELTTGRLWYVSAIFPANANFGLTLLAQDMPLPWKCFIRERCFTPSEVERYVQ